MAQVGIYPRVVPGVHSHENVNQGGQIDHGAALVGHADDDHVRYFDRDASKELWGILDFLRQDAVINAGVISASRSGIRIDTEGGAASDDLDTINGFVAEGMICLRAQDNTHTVVVKHLTGNINNGNLGDISLDSRDIELIYVYSDDSGTWLLAGYTGFLTKARIDALAINADQVDGEEANAITTNARVKAHFPDSIVNILNNHTKAVHDALAINADQVDGEEANAITTNARVKAHFPDSIVNILNNHTKAVHDALAINAGQVDGVEGADIVQRDGSIPLTAEWQADQAIRVTYVYSTAGGVIVLGEVAGQTRLVRDANEVAKILGVSNAIGGIKVNKVIIGANELNALVANNKIGDSSNWDGKTFGDLDGKIRFNAPLELTIAGGVITVTKSYHKLLGQGGAADDLDTINGGVDGMMLVLKGNGGHNITVKDGVGNIELDGSVDFLMDVANKKLLLIYDAVTTDWCEISRGINSI